MTTPARRARPTAPAAALAIVLVTAAGCGASTADTGSPDAVDGASPGAGPTAASAEADPAGTAPPSDGAALVEVSTLAGEGCPDATVGADFPDVVGARFEPVTDAPGEYRVAVTLCSRYDTPERYADAWRVVTPDGDVLGTRELLHDHATEQPFTRSLSGTLTVPGGVDRVVVEARDLVNGWGGTRLEVDLSG